MLFFHTNMWLLAFRMNRALTMIKGTVTTPITLSWITTNPTKVYITVSIANNRLALLGLFQVTIAASITMIPGRRAHKNSHTLKPGSKSKSMRRKNNPTTRARILGA